MSQMLPVRKKILLFIDWFWPGYKAGGPIRAAVNFVTHMKDNYDVYVFTTDRDLDSSVPYADVEVNNWTSYEGLAKVYYASPEKLSWRGIEAIVREVGPGFIYINSLFSRYFTIYPLLVCRQIRFSGKVIMAPRGMLKASALKFKSLKKKIYLTVFNKLGLHRNILFQATDTTESIDVKSHFEHADVQMVPDFPQYVDGYPGPKEKKAGELRIIFVGRIHPIKQLHFLLDLLRSTSGSLLLTIVGVEEDPTYAERCRKVISTYNANIEVIFKGAVPNHELPAMLGQHHIFALPTQGENFGHAIFEALAQGKPVLISDQTPWKNLRVSKAGWDIPLGQPESFKNALEQAIQMDQREYNVWSESAWKFAKNYIVQSDIVTQYLKLFS